MDYAWLPYYVKVAGELDKIKFHKDYRKLFDKLDFIYKLGGIIPLYTTYNELDKLNDKIKKILLNK